MKHKLRLIFLILLICICSDVYACIVHTDKKISLKKITGFKTTNRKLANSTVNYASLSVKKSLEAKLGNILLSEKMKMTIISVPVVLLKSDFKPYGDGQANSKMDFGTFWKEEDFPVVGYQVTENKQSTRSYIFHKNLKVTDYTEDNLGDGWFKITPKSWKDSFYFNFDPSVKDLKNFLVDIPENYRKFSNNRIAPNIAKIELNLSPSKFSSLGEGFNADPWFADNVHGVFPNAEGSKTAIGGMLSWGITDKNFGPFKDIYSCFDSRNIDLENKVGSPSGAGWHLIGDPAEFILNNLQTSMLPVAVGRQHKFNNAAYGLTEVITASWLQQDHVLITQQGQFHWYLNPEEKPICVEIWISNCNPTATNSWGFNCK